MGSSLIDRQAAIEAIKTWGLVDGLSEGQAIEILADKDGDMWVELSLVKRRQDG